MGMTIRTARSFDRARILEISAQIWEGEDYVPLVIDEWMRMRNSEVVVAELNGTVIAFARMVNLAPRYVWLEGIRTDKECQGKGVGTAITSYFLEKAAREEAVRVGLSTYIENYASIHIVEKAGFRHHATFILAEAPLDTPARTCARTSPAVVSVPLPEAQSYILASQVMKMSNGFLPQGWKFWPIARPEIVTTWPPIDRTFGLRSSDGSLRALAVSCAPDHGADNVSIDFLDGSPEDAEVLVRHLLAACPGAVNVQAMIPAQGERHTVLLETLTALSFNLWRHGEPDVLVYERSTQPA